MTTRSTARGAATQLRLDLEKPPSHARKDFVASESNRAALTALDAWPVWPGGKLALIGPAGSGKTHLAKAWAERVGAVIPTPHFSLDLFPASANFLFEDADRRADDERLFHLMNMADAGASLLVTGRTAPATWSVRLPDLRSRLNALTVVPIDPPDDIVLLAVMKKLLSERNIKPSPDVPDYALRRMERSVPAMHDLVSRIDEISGLEKREVTRALVKQILEFEPPSSDDQV